MKKVKGKIKQVDKPKRPTKVYMLLIGGDDYWWSDCVSPKLKEVQNKITYFKNTLHKEWRDFVIVEVDLSEV